MNTFLQYAKNAIDCGLETEKKAIEFERNNMAL